MAGLGFETYVLRYVTYVDPTGNNNNNNNNMPPSHITTIIIYQVFTMGFSALPMFYGQLHQVEARHSNDHADVTTFRPSLLALYKHFSPPSLDFLL